MAEEKKRDDRVDSLKGVLITLVVFGHCFLYGTPQEECKMIIANYVYLFHMPFFIFLSGYFTHPKNGSFWNSLLALLESYIVFQVIKGFLQGYSLVEYFCVPAPMMWYLFVLIIWKLVLYTYDKLFGNRVYPGFVKWLSILVLFIIGLLVGFFPEIGKQFALSRLFTFTPFFFMGVAFQNIDFVTYCKRIPKWIALLVLIIPIILVVYFTSYDIINLRETVRGISGYEIDKQFVGVIGRMSFYLLACLMSISITCLVRPSRLLSHIGRDSMKYYLFHGIFLSVMVYLRLPWNWYFALLYGVMLMAIIYVVNLTTLSGIVIRPVSYLINIIKKKK